MSSQHDIFDNRKQFQLERLILFSDAVFAIAITLLVLEIKIPKANWTKSITAAELNDYLRDVLPDLFGFVLSFFIIGFNWTIHHRVFGHIINFDGKLIWLNLLMLFFIVLLPFTTTITEYGYLSESFFFYWLNVGMISLVIFFIQLHASNPNKNLSVGYEDKNMRRYSLGRSLLTALIFFTGAAFCYAHNSILLTISRYIYVLIIPGMITLKRIYRVSKKNSH